jgi:hypothetical protein
MTEKGAKLSVSTGRARRRQKRGSRSRDRPLGGRNSRSSRHAKRVACALCCLQRGASPEESKPRWAAPHHSICSTQNHGSPGTILGSPGVDRSLNSSSPRYLIYFQLRSIPHSMPSRLFAFATNYGNSDFARPRYCTRRSDRIGTPAPWWLSHHRQPENSMFPLTELHTSLHVQSPFSDQVAVHTQLQTRRPRPSKTPDRRVSSLVLLPT